MTKFEVTPPDTYLIRIRPTLRVLKPRRRDLLVIILGFAGLSFIVIVGYFARPL